MRFLTLTVIPAYNEAETIEYIIKQCIIFSDVLVINDGSKDNTKEVSEAAGAEVVNHSENFGYERAIKTGADYFLKKEQYDKLIYVDADGEISCSCAQFMVSQLSPEVPIIIGSREKKYRLVEKIICIWINHQFQIEDVMCGCKAFHRSVISNFTPAKLSGLCFTHCAVMLAQTGVRIKNYPVYGSKRLGTPRFGGLLKANLKLCKLGITLLWRVYADQFIAKFLSKKI